MHGISDISVSDIVSSGSAPCKVSPCPNKGKLLEHWQPNDTCVAVFNICIVQRLRPSIAVLNVRTPGRAAALTYTTVKWQV